MGQVQSEINDNPSHSTGQANSNNIRSFAHLLPIVALIIACKMQLLQK